MLSKARVAQLCTLERGGERRREGHYLIEGTRLVREALESGAPVQEVLVTVEAAESPSGGEIRRLAGESGVALTAMSDRDCRRIADTKTPQGVVAVVRCTEPDPAILDGPGLYLALDGVADPGNVGTLLRSADAFGVRAVLAGPGTADFLNGKTLRAAMGSGFHVPAVRTDDLPAVLRRMKESGAALLAGVLDGEDPFRLKDPGDFLVVILGNEAHGLSDAVAGLANLRLTIPCPGRAESLNVAMAGAILLSALCRRAGGAT